jgi:hypothetical protein
VGQCARYEEEARVATPAQLRKLIARLERRLRGEKLNRYQLLDLATVLVFVHYELEYQLGDVEGYAHMPQVETGDTALATMHSNLQVLLTSSDLASDEDIRARLQDALRHATTAAGFLTPGTARQL